MALGDSLDSLLTRRDALLTLLAESPADAALRESWRSVRAEIDARRAELARGLVDRIRIAAPCSADWASMSGGERVRHCATCEKNVYAVSDMSAVEIATLLMEHEGSLCLRLYRRPDGTVLTSDCEVGVTRRKRKLRVLGGVAVAAMAGLAAGAAVGTSTAPEPAHLVDARPKVRPPAIVMGAIAGPIDMGRDPWPSIDAFLSSSRTRGISLEELRDPAEVMAEETDLADGPEALSPPAPRADGASE